MTALPENSPRPGDIYNAAIGIIYAGRQVYSHDRTHILIYDVQPVAATDAEGERAWPEHDGEGLHILWSPAYRDTDGGWSTGGDPHWSLLDYTGYDRTDRADRLGVEVTAAGSRRLTLRGHAGTYKARDPHLNSIAVLRNSAIKAIAVREAHEDRQRPANLVAATDTYNADRHQAEQSKANLDEVIRAARAAETPVRTIARVTGLTEARIRQIEHGTR